MKIPLYRPLRFALFASLAALVVFATPGVALAFCGGAHLHAAGEACSLFRDVSTPDQIDRGTDVPLFPEISREDGFTWYDPNTYDVDDDTGEGSEVRTLYDWTTICSMKADDVDDTRHHFWDADDNLDECPEGWVGLNNAWETVQPFYNRALAKWQAGDLVGAYACLGYASHYIGDMGQPAHTNSDLHGPGNLDSLEEWFDDPKIAASFTWDPDDAIPQPGPPRFVTKSGAEILADMRAATSWPGSEDIDDYADLADPNNMYNIQQLFWLMYVTNQTANWFPSDGEDGNSTELIGWLGGYAGFPTQMMSDGSPCSVHDQAALDDNEDECENGNPTGRCNEGGCDCDGDLSTIMQWGYGAAFRSLPGLIDLFRRTVDAVPPITEFETSQLDGDPVEYWNNSPITVELTDAVDGANPGFRASGVWQRWAKANEITPTVAPSGTPYLLINQEGIYDVRFLSTDWCGNVEGAANDFEVGLDMTPPDITFLGLRPNYLTSETFTATWVATDELSGVVSEVAYLDGASVAKGQAFDLAEMAGEHVLEVYAEDAAGNLRYAIFEFEVWIDASGWAQPIWHNNKTSGKGMFVGVEFPAPYDVAAIEVTTCVLYPRAILDLEQTFPVIGGFDAIPGELLTGVGDHDEDGIPDRMVRFDKERFAIATGGLTGDIPAIMVGGLMPDGTPRFIVQVVVPVFAPPGK